MANSGLTLTRIIGDGRRKQAIYSNWNPISREIFGNIRADLEREQAVPGSENRLWIPEKEHRYAADAMQIAKWRMGQTSFNGHKVARSGYQIK